MTPKILSKPRYFHGCRFALVKFLTRFGAVEYHISDADTVSDADVRTGKFAEIVYQGDYQGALAYMRDHRISY